MASSSGIPVGRLRRLGRLAAVGPRAGAEVAKTLLRRRVGRAEEGELGGEAVGEVLFQTLGDLKAVSLKVGQLVAQAADGLPEGARLRLGRLYSQAPPLPWSVVVGLLEAELGAPVETHFAHFETVPFAGASLGQVHRATLREGGQAVAVKIQYPGVGEALVQDLEVLGRAVDTASLGGLVFDAGTYFSTFREATLAELDYRQEVDRMGEMAAVLARWPDLVVPRACQRLCTSRVLTSDLLTGPTLHERFGDSGPQAARDALAERVVRAVFGPLFGVGLVNADAHPGNFIVLEGDHLGLVDFGAVASVDAGVAEGMRELARSLRNLGERDWRRRFAAAGISMDLPEDRATAYLEDLARLLAPAFRGPVNFGRDRVLEQVGRLKQERPRDTLGFRADRALLPVGRAILGVYHALKHLGATIDVGRVIEELPSGGQPPLPGR